MFHRQTPYVVASATPSLTTEPRAGSSNATRRRRLVIPTIFVVIVVVAVVLGLSILLDLKSSASLTKSNTATTGNVQGAGGRVATLHYRQAHIDPDSSEIVGHFDVGGVTFAAHDVEVLQAGDQLPDVDPRTLTTKMPPPPPPTPTPRVTETLKPPTIVYHPTPAPPPSRPGSELLALMKIHLLTPRRNRTGVPSDNTPSARPNSNSTFAPTPSSVVFNTSKAGLLAAYATEALRPIEGPVCIVAVAPPGTVDVSQTAFTVWGDDSTLLVLDSSNDDPSETNQTATTQIWSFEYKRWAKVRRRFLKRLAKANSALRLQDAFDADQSNGWFSTFHFLSQQVKSASVAFAQCQWFVMVHTNAFVRKKVLEKSFLSKLNHGQIMRVGIETTFRVLPLTPQAPGTQNGTKKVSLTFDYGTAAAGLAFSRGLMEMVDTLGCARTAVEEPSILIRDDALIGYCIANHAVGADMAPVPSFVGTASVLQTNAALTAAALAPKPGGGMGCRECVSIACPVDLPFAKQLQTENVRIGWGRQCSAKSCGLLLVDGMEPSVGSSWPTQEANMSALIRTARVRASNPPTWFGSTKVKA